MTKLRGLCPVCEKEAALRADGLLYPHNGVTKGQRCAGSQQAPRSG